MLSNCGAAMGWLQLVGSSKLYVSFAKETYERDDILQKRPIILRSLLIVATPQIHRYTSVLTSSYTLIYVYRLLQICLHRYTSTCICTQIHIYWCVKHTYIYLYTFTYLLMSDLHLRLPVHRYICIDA